MSLYTFIYYLYQYIHLFPSCINMRAKNEYNIFFVTRQTNFNNLKKN